MPYEISSESSHPGPSKQKCIIFLLVTYIILFVCVAFFVSEWKYNTFRLNWPFDLTSNSHYMWNLAHGNRSITITPSRGANGPDIFRRDHFSPISFILLPFYSLLPKTETLFFLQVFIISLGVIPAYLIAKKNNIGTDVALILSAFYILSPPIFNLAVYNFEPLCLCIPFLMFAFYFYIKKDFLNFLIFSI